MWRLAPQRQARRKEGRAYAPPLQRLLRKVHLPFRGPWPRASSRVTKPGCGPTNTVNSYELTLSPSDVAARDLRTTIASARSRSTGARPWGWRWGGLSCQIESSNEEPNGSRYNASRSSLRVARRAARMRPPCGRAAKGNKLRFNLLRSPKHEVWRGKESACHTACLPCASFPDSVPFTFVRASSIPRLFCATRFMQRRARCGALLEEATR